MIGEELMDRFKILELLEGGKRLSTYLALDMALRMEVEVDILQVSLSDFPIPASRVEEILDAAMHVRNPDIITFHGWGDESDLGFVWMVRDRAEGKPLSEILSESAGLPLQQVEGVVETAIGVLAEAYGKGLFYLGLNPGQILVGPRGEIRLYRAGYGWLLEEMEPLLAARVSPYRAPETDGAVEGSRTSDIYSLAVMLHEMLPPEAVSGRLRELLERCVDPLPKRRPSSPRLLLEELQSGGGESEGGSGGGSGGGNEGESSAGEGREGCGEKPFSRRRRVGGLRFLTGGGNPKRNDFFEARAKPRPLRALALAVAGGLVAWAIIAAVSGGMGKRETDEAGEAVEVRGEERVTLPDLEGLTVQEAEELLENLGLASTSREAPSRLWSAGRVVAQEPGEGTVLHAGDTVCLVVSSGSDDGLEPVGDGADETAASQPDMPGGEALPTPASSDPEPPGRGSAPASSGPIPPSAIPALSTRRGASPLYLFMDGSGSYDPDGYVTRYVWDCGDGTFLEGVTAQHVFDPTVIPCRFQVVLKVFDDDGLSSSSALSVEVY